MIKSLAVYGDSFGTYSLSGDAHQQQKGLQHHWSTLLSVEYGCEVTNYALSGSSVYYSYYKFMSTHHLHDCVVFLITSPSRYIHPIKFTFGEMCVTNQNQIEVREKTRKDLMISDTIMLDKLKNWSELTDDDFCYDVVELIVGKVKRERSDVILLPCFNISLRDDFRNQLNIQENTNLSSLYERQMEELNLSDDGMNLNWKENSEYISGHLTPEYNQIAYENISYFMKNGVWNWNIPSDSIITSNDKVNYYNKV